MQWLETSNRLQIGKMQPASYSYSQEQVPDHQDAFRKTCNKCRPLRRLPLYLSLRRQENHSESWNAAETGVCE